ncbi:MAG: hypothetical protein KGY99_10115 [Phycisphaerae bacterium]|nr:hypothetical protein [Phycisphaerae bacterium]
MKSLRQHGRVRWCAAAVAAAMLAALGHSAVADGSDVAGLHVSGDSTTGLAHVITDGGGFRWDIQRYGTVGSGTNNAYGQGMFLRLGSDTIRSPNGRARISADGRELEIGPHRHGKLLIYRRIRVYKDRAMARWLEIIENPTGDALWVNADLATAVPYGIGVQVGSSGRRGVGADDWAFMTEAANKSTPPALLHVLRDKRLKRRPEHVRIEGNNIQVRWRLKLPPRSSVILCTFQSQDHALAGHHKRLKRFRAAELLRDLPVAVRRRIVNFRAGTFVADVSLDRSDEADTVVTDKGDPMYGRIVNEGFTLSTLYGSVALPADRIVGMAAVEGGGGAVRTLTTDGQVLSGTLGEQRIQIELSDGGGRLAVPADKLAQWSYKISSDRPLDVPFSAPVAVLRTGDRLVFDAESTPLMFRTRHGTIALDAHAIQEVRLGGDGGVHRVVFANGSELAGFLEPTEVVFHLKLGPELTVSRNMLGQLVFSRETHEDLTLTDLTLTNGDVLRGRLGDAPLRIQSDYGRVRIDPLKVRTVGFASDRGGRAVVELWDESILRGRLENDTVTIKLLPGPELHVSTALLRRVARSQPLSPEALRQRVRELVVRLGGESYADRAAATEELVELGGVIVPMLRRHLDVNDPEVRQRLEAVIEKIGQGGSARAPSTSEASALLLGGAQLAVPVRPR